MAWVPFIILDNDIFLQFLSERVVTQEKTLPFSKNFTILKQPIFSLEKTTSLINTAVNTGMHTSNAAPPALATTKSFLCLAIVCLFD